MGYTMFQKGVSLDIDKMFHILIEHKVTHLVDVRSIPISKQYPQCNSNNLKFVGKRYGVPYIHMPELGAKADPTREIFSKASDIFLNKKD